MTLWVGAPDESHDPAKLGDHGLCGSGNIMALVCHMILQIHEAKDLGNLMGASPSR